MTSRLPDQQAFSAAVNSQFSVLETDGSVSQFKLVECRSHVSNERQECYSLYFLAPPDRPRRQEIYRLKNEQLGEMELFLVPIKQDEHGLYFEAVMNQLISR